MKGWLWALSLSLVVFFGLASIEVFAPQWYEPRREILRLVKTGALYLSVGLVLLWTMKRGSAADKGEQ